MGDDNLIKVHFELNANDWHLYPGEFVWAEPVRHPLNRVAALRNSPFHVSGVSFLDLVQVDIVEEEGGVIYEFARVVERSGHSTFMILIPPDSSNFIPYWQRLQKLGCWYESGTVPTSFGQKLLYSVDAPPETDIDAVYAALIEGEKEGIWIFQEGQVEREVEPTMPRAIRFSGRDGGLAGKP